MNLTLIRSIYLIITFLVFILSPSFVIAGEISSPISVIAAPKGSPELKILFVGNEMLGNKDLPGVFANIAATNTTNPIKITIGRMLNSKSTLYGLWSDNWAAKTPPLKSQHWDYVVLLDSLGVYIMEGGDYLGDQGSTMWAGGARLIGAKVLLIQPWIIAPNSEEYHSKTLQQYNTPNLLQARIDSLTKRFSANSKAEIVPIGDQWQKCLNSIKHPMLWDADGMSPSLAGTHLNALMLYKKITKYELNQVTYNPGLSDSDMQWNKTCASK